MDYRGRHQIKYYLHEKLITKHDLDKNYLITPGFEFQLMPVTNQAQQIMKQLEMWANAQRDGRPVEHRWRPLFNAAKFG